MPKLWKLSTSSVFPKKADHSHGKVLTLLHNFRILLNTFSRSLCWQRSLTSSSSSKLYLFVVIAFNLHATHEFIFFRFDSSIHCHSLFRIVITIRLNSTSFIPTDLTLVLWIIPRINFPFETLSLYNVFRFFFWHSTKGSWCNNNARKWFFFSLIKLLYPQDSLFFTRCSFFFPSPHSEYPLSLCESWANRANNSNFPHKLYSVRLFLFRLCEKKQKRFRDSEFETRIPSKRSDTTEYQWIFFSRIIVHVRKMKSTQFF